MYKNTFYFVILQPETICFNPIKNCFMKKFLLALRISLLAVTAGYLATGCKSDSTDDAPKDPAFSAVLAVANSTSADIQLTTTRITEAAYLIADEETPAPDAAVVFATGTRGITCQDGETLVTVRNLNPLSEYVIYFAGITDEEAYYDDVVAVSVSTTDFAEDIAVYDISCDRFKLRIRVPDNVAEGNVIKWGLNDIAMFNMSRMQGGFDADLLNLNDEYYHNYFSEDRIFSFSNDESDRLVLDENGDPALNEMGETTPYFEPIVPGGKYMVSFGEFSQGESLYGWGQGYYNPLFDMEGYFDAMMTGIAPDENDYWTGFHQNVLVELEAPEALDASLNITTNLRPNGGIISFTPDEEIEVYCYTVIDQATYDQVLAMALDNDPANMQWFLTTTYAMYSIAVYSASGPVDLVVEDWFYTLDPDMTYKVLAVGMGDELGHSQCYETLDFTLPDPTEPAPELEVKAIDNPKGEESPYEVWFNVKCPTKDAVEGMYACNYEREWETALAGGYTNESLISSGYEFSSTEIGEINSDAGLNVSFSSREDAVTYFGVVVSNYEGTPSEAAVAKGKTIPEPAAEPVSSTLFEDLLGDWTATATVQYSTYNYDTWQTETVTEEFTSKVTIGNVGYEATLPDEVYDIFFQYSNYTTREEVDAVYDEFKAAVDLFNQKTRNQNRLLCQGLSLLVENYGIDYCAYASPYELFTSESYNGYDSESPVFDFGPKWYLQIAADGSLSVPFNMNMMAPLTAWQEYGTYYLLGASETSALPYIPDGSSAQNGYFPAEVSQDKNTITVNPLEYGGDTYYPNIGNYSYGSFQFRSKIISPIVLTRGWSGEEASQSAVRTKVGKTSPANLPSQYEVTPVKRDKSRTPIVLKNNAPRKQVKGHIVTREEFNANVEKLMTKLRGSRK